MSAVSGLNSKAEKGRAKYVALDINSLYKGKSLETTKTTVQPKHGLQSLGKVGAGRRMPPPANLPSLKSEHSGNNPNVSLVPSGGQGWGTTPKDKAADTPEGATTTGQPPSQPPSQPASSQLSQATQKPNTTSTASTPGASKTWSSVTSSQEDGGPERNFLGQQSPFFPQEFPKLAGGDAPTEGNQKSSADSQYGPGPSLRPQTEGSWGRGTGGVPPPSVGSGVNGPPVPPPPDPQRPSFQVPPPNMPPQFRGMMPSFMMGRNNYPSGYPSNFTNVPPPSPQQNARPQYPYSDNRRQQPVRPLGEEEAYQRPAAIITEKALKGFDEILQNDTTDTWATSHGEIDYNAKLVFSDDEESPANVKKDKRDGEEKPQKGHSKVEKERDRKPERDRGASDRDSRPQREGDWNKKNEQDSDWSFERGDNFERGDRHGTNFPRGVRQTQQRSTADEDEMWRQRRKQHTEEMTLTVERARQRRAEEEKHYEQSKQCAQEKAKSFDKVEKEKEVEPHDDAERSRHSSESREDKPPSRERRESDRERSQPNYQGYNFSRQFQKNVPPRFQKQAAEYMRQQQGGQPQPPQQPMGLGPGSHFMRSQTSPGAPPLPYDNQGWGQHPSYVGQMTGMPPPMSKGMPRQRSNSQGSATDSYESDVPEPSPVFDRDPKENYWRDRRQPAAQGYESWHAASNEVYFEPKTEPNKMYDQRHDFKRGGPEKEEKSFDSHHRETDRRDKEFESQDYRYKGRDSFKETQKHSETREAKDKSSKSNSWAREYDERSQDVFEEPHEVTREKPQKERNYERPEKEQRWEKERPARPDSRDSRGSRDSAKDDRHAADRNEHAAPPPERERKGMHSREEKKEKSMTLDWGESPYPGEPKRREWYHHPPPITPKQFESIGPPKKNLTPLRRSNAPPVSTIPEKKNEKEEPTGKKIDQDTSSKKDKEAKEEKNEKIKNESSVKDSDKSVDKFEHKSYSKDSSKKIESDISSDVSKKDSAQLDDKDKSKDKHEHSLQGRDRRRDVRERGVNSRPRGGNSFQGGNNNVNPASSGGGSGRYENLRGGRGGNGSNQRSSGPYNAPLNVQMGAALVPGGSSAYRGKREYRRSKVERGPRFERQKDKGKDDKKDKHSDDTSGSDVDEGKVHLRQKDEDSEVSVDEASASTTESAQAEKYQGPEVGPDEDKGFMNTQVSIKEINAKNEKYKKEKKDSSRSDSKPYEKELKEDKGGFAPRGEPSRRGRGGGNTLSFRNSRGGSRHGPSSYGPPPSRAGFGGNKQEKIEEQKIVEENFNDDMQGDFKNNISNVENNNTFPNRDSKKSRSLERSQQRRSGRFDHLPPRFQKTHGRHFDKFDPPATRGGRGRGSGNRGFQVPGNPANLGKMGQGGKENLSDVGNEEWETASESSDIADRRDRLDDDDPRKNMRDRGSRKSFSGQRPMNPDAMQGRRPSNDSRRGGGYAGDRNRQMPFPRDTRPREPGGRGRSSNNNNNVGGDRRMMNNNNNGSNNSRPSSSAGHPGGMGRRNGNPPPKPGPFLPKNEGTAAVYRCDEIKLQDPGSVQAALTDLTNRRNMKADVGIPKIPKCENKDKAGGLEGYDLNNYASVVIIDDHPEVEDESNLLCGTDDGFQEVTSKKRHKVMVENEVKKMKKEPQTRNKNGSRSRQSRLPPRFIRQRENGVKSVAPGANWEIGVELSPKSGSLIKDTNAPPMNAWEKPIILRSTSPTSTSASVSASVATSAVANEVQVLATTSKSSSFDRSDQHDSGIDVSDQPASAASSQRSSPSNDCKILTQSGSGKEVSDLASEIDTCKPMCTVVFENKNFKAENAVLDKFGGQGKGQSIKEISISQGEILPPVGSSVPKSKESSSETCEEKSHCTAPSYPTKESFGKNEEANNMKLDFTFDSSLEQLTDDKSSRNSANSHLSNKGLNMGRSMDGQGGVSPGVQSPISPSADDLNLKIQSVKKVWENDPPLPTVMEHPQAGSEESNCPTSYGSFTTNSDPSANVYNCVDPNSQSRKETDVSEISYRDSPSLQQVSKVVEHTSVKMTMAPPSAPLSPPLMGGLDMRTMAGLASSVHAIPSPPTVLFNSSQQMAQTAGMYQPLQMDNRQTPASAVAAAMVQFSHSPQGYAPMGTYGQMHPQAPPNQLSGAYGQQSLFVQPQQQSQDLYSSSQYRVQPPYAPQNQQLSSNQVLSAQQNLAGSHLLGTQLVQARGGASAAAPHLQGLHGLQPAPQTSYFSTAAQPPQATGYYHQPPTAPTPGSPQYQNFPGSQLQQAGPPSFRNYSQFKAPGILPERSATRSPTVDVSAANRSMFSVSTPSSTALSSAGSNNITAATKQLNNPTLPVSRINAVANAAKTSQYSLQSQAQHYYPFGAQQKYGNVRPPQVLYQNVVPRNATQTATALHYPPPIQRPAATVQPTVVAQPPQMQPPKMGIRPPPLPPQQAGVLVPGGKLTSAQLAKLRAEAVQQTHMFFAQSGGKPIKMEDPGIPQEKTGDDTEKATCNEAVSGEAKEVNTPKAEE